MTFADAVENLTSDSERRLVALFEKFRAGEITAAQFQAVAVPLVGAARARGIALADLGLAAAYEAEYRTPTPVLGLQAPAGDPERLAKGLSTLLEADTGADEYVSRVARYGRSEPAAAMQDSYIEGMKVRKVPGFTRGLNAGACQLCVWLYKSGYVYPVDAGFHRHTGCTCHIVPAFRTVRAY
ncbi:hypothetical protein GCM10027063_40470 [Promicromonospora xylanilytica]